VPLLDVLAAFPAKLDLLNSVLSDSGLSAEERAHMEGIKAVGMRQHADYGGRLDYQLLFGLGEPVRWHRYEKFAIGFDEGAKVCLCCAVLYLTCMYKGVPVLCCLTCMYKGVPVLCCTMTAICHADTVWCSSATLLLPLFLCCFHT